MKRVIYAKRGTPTGYPFCMAALPNCAVWPQEILSPRKDTSSPMASSGTAR